MKFVAKGKREEREKSTQTPFRPPRNPRGATDARTLDPSGRRSDQLVRHGAAFKNIC